MCAAADRRAHEVLVVREQNGAHLGRADGASRTKTLIETAQREVLRRPAGP